RTKYFGNQKNLHPAFKLTPNQLEEIGWLSVKQKDFKGFQKNPDQILSDWKEYVHYEQSKFFALFMCMANLENKKQKQKESLKWYIDKCKEKPIHDTYSCIYKKYKHYKQPKLYALFTCMANIENKKQKQKESLK